MVIIYLYDSTVTDFTYNGQPLNKAYEVVVESNINDSFFVTFNHPLDDKGKYKTIEKDKIVKVHTPDGMQPFRIMDRVKYMDHISIEAWPLFYADMRNKLVKPLAIRGLTGQAAMNMFVNNLLIDTPFTFTSNITDTHDYHTQDTEERENNPNQFYDALDVFKDIVKRWQGELVINGYDVRVVNRLGKNTGALLYEKKNISDFTDEESIQDITTRLYGKAEWTERPEGSDEEVKHQISVKVESPLINAYSGIVFEKQYTNNDIRTEKEMTDWLNLKFTTENIDKPSRNIKVGTNIIDDTVIDLGDSLMLKYVKHDVDMEIRMVGYTYDGYANRYITIQLGDAKQSYVGNVQNTVREIETNVNTAVKQTVNQILNANGERMIYSVNEPVGNFKNGDVWFDQQGGMYMWDEASAMWIDHPYNRNMNVIGEKIENEIKPAINQMTTNISNADNKANDALDKVSLNAELIEEHKDIITGLNGQLSEDLVTDKTVLNPKKWLTNYGELVANNGYDTTDYLPVSEGDLLSLESTVSHYYKVAFYDKAKNNLGYYDGSKVVLTPNGTAYFGNTAVFKVPADGYVRISYSTATGGADTVKLSNQNNLYTLINSGYNNALNALINANIAMQEFGENLVSLNTLNKGYWLNALGALMENSAYKTTDYIRVDAGETYQLKGGYAVYQVYFYDAGHQAVAYYDGKNIKDDIGTGLKYFTATPNLELVIPTNASYARIASSIADFSKVEFRKISTIIADTQKAIDFIKNEMLPQVSKDIENMRNDLSIVSDTAQSSLNIIGIDRGSFYSKNRRLGAKSQTIQKGDTAEILHNGDGFEVGKVYTLSFKAECIIGDIIEWVERTRTETIPFERVVQYSDTLRPDESYVQTAGVNGQATYAWQVETVNGVETGKRTNEIRTSYSPPVNEIYIQGTKTTSTVNFTIRRKLQDLSEARIVQIGDSITMGYGRDIKIPDVVKSELNAQSVQNAGYGSTTASLHPNKPELRKIGFTKLVDSIVSGNWSEALNADLSGISYATPQTYKQSLTNLSNTNFNDVDAVIIMYGTNDWAMDVKLDNSSNRYDQSTYLGALRYGIEKLQQAYPHLEILVAQPILWTMGSITSEAYNNSIGLKVRDYANALNNVLNADVPIAQIYNKGITTSNYTNYFNTGDSSDGTHPNSAGNAVIGKLIASEFTRLIDIKPSTKGNSTVNFEIIKTSTSTVNFEINKGG